MKQTIILLALLISALHLPAQTNTNTLTFTVNGVTFNMKKVEGGTFNMGATPEQQNPAADEQPAHQVTLATYYIGETEVTQALWQAVMRANPSTFKGPQLPVENISLQNCTDFIQRLNQLTGRTFRLPTEAEWEYAARGGSKSRNTQYSGSQNIAEVAWHKANSQKKTHPVKTKTPNELGIYDMTGNVMEWTPDAFDMYNPEPQTNPAGPAITDPAFTGRVTRGGSFFLTPEYCRTAARNYTMPEAHGSNLGLRLALTN